MSKRRVERALRAKGLECSVLEYTRQIITPGEVIGGWDIQLTEDCEDLVADADPGFDDWDPDCWSTA